MYTLIGTGVEVYNDRAAIRKYKVAEFTYHELTAAICRMYEYIAHGFHVSLYSLLLAVILPRYATMQLCTSFCQYVLEGVINPAVCNSMRTFEAYAYERSDRYS